MAECFCFVRVLAVLDINIYSCPTSNVFFFVVVVVSLFLKKIHKWSCLNLCYVDIISPRIITLLTFHTMKTKQNIYWINKKNPRQHALRNAVNSKLKWAFQSLWCLFSVWWDHDGTSTVGERIFLSAAAQRYPPLLQKLLRSEEGLEVGEGERPDVRARQGEDC